MISGFRTKCSLKPLLHAFYVFASLYSFDLGHIRPFLGFHHWSHYWKSIIAYHSLHGIIWRMERRIPHSLGHHTIMLSALFCSGRTLFCVLVSYDGVLDGMMNTPVFDLFFTDGGAM